jgi:hypothetical protein
MFIGHIGAAFGTKRVTPRPSLGALFAFLLAIYAGDRFGPPPADQNAFAWGTLAMWLLVLWAAWVDRHRDTAPVLAPVHPLSDAGRHRA